MKNLRKLTILLTMILCIFSVISLSSVDASATVGPAYASNPYLTTYSNGCTEAYGTINYMSGEKEHAWANISWLLRKGSSSNSVKLLQALLNRAMGSYMTVDGIFGDETQDMLIKYQAWIIGEQYADGICGPQTWRSLVYQIQDLEDILNHC